MSFDPKQMQFVKPAPTAKHSRLDMFEESIRRGEAWFDRLLDMPIVLAALVLIFYVAVVGTVAGLLGWRP